MKYDLAIAIASFAAAVFMASISYPISTVTCLIIGTMNIFTAGYKIGLRDGWLIGRRESKVEMYEAIVRSVEDAEATEMAERN